MTVLSGSWLVNELTTEKSVDSRPHESQKASGFGPPQIHVFT
jgi:hypothetical protein